MRYLIGIGNYYGFDDSIGLRVVEAVSERGLDRDFQAIDLGGNLLDLVHYLGEETEQVLIVDSAEMGLAPGEFRIFTPDEVATRKPVGSFSTHEADLMKVLEFAKAMGEAHAPITILGIQPGEIRAEPGLSSQLAGCFDEYVQTAVLFFEGRQPS